MTLDFTKQGKVMVLMIDYIDNMLASLDSDIDGVKSTPAASHLFNVNPSMKVRHRSTVNVAKTLFCANSCGLIYRQQWLSKHQNQKTDKKRRRMMSVAWQSSNS